MKELRRCPRSPGGGLRKARLTGIRVKLPVETLDAKLASLARGGVGFSGPDRGAVQRGEGRREQALRAGQGARERLRAVRGARRRGSRRWGRGVRMSEALLQVAAEPVVVGRRGSRCRPAGADRRRRRGWAAPRPDKTRHPGRAPGPGAALGDALQLRAGERGPGDEMGGLLPAGEPGGLRLHEKGGRRQDVPAHHRAAEAIDAYLEAAGSRSRRRRSSRVWNGRERG